VSMGQIGQDCSISACKIAILDDVESRAMAQMTVERVAQVSLFETWIFRDRRFDQKKPRPRPRPKRSVVEGSAVFAE
jgi:hypothetical protein